MDIYNCFFCKLRLTKSFSFQETLCIKRSMVSTNKSKTHKYTFLRFGFFFKRAIFKLSFVRSLHFEIIFFKKKLIFNKSANMGFTKEELKTVLPALVGALRDLIKNPVGCIDAVCGVVFVSNGFAFFWLGCIGRVWHKRAQNRGGNRESATSSVPRAWL